MKFFLILLSIILTSCAGHKKRIALSFDDAPTNDGWKFKGVERTQTIIKKLNELKVKRAAFYVQTSNLKKNEDIYRIQQYFLAGHMIGNHTHSHPSASKMRSEEFIQDIIRAQNILKDRNFKVSYFRFPYLHRGKTPEKLTESLTTLGLQDGYVTVDTYDWYMDMMVQKHFEEMVNLIALRAAYLEAILESVEFYDKIAREYIDEEFTHTLLLHENDLAAEYIGDLISALEAKGWEIVAADEAYFNNPLNEFPVKAIGHTQGRVIAFAQTKGYKGPIKSKYEDAKAIDELLVRHQVFGAPPQ